MRQTNHTHLITLVALFNLSLSEKILKCNFIPVFLCELCLIVTKIKLISHPGFMKVAYFNRNNQPEIPDNL